MKIFQTNVDNFNLNICEQNENINTTCGHVEYIKNDIQQNEDPCYNDNNIYFDDDKLLRSGESVPSITTHKISHDDVHKKKITEQNDLDSKNYIKRNHSSNNNNNNYSNDKNILNDDISMSPKKKKAKYNNSSKNKKESDKCDDKCDDNCDDNRDDHCDDNYDDDSHHNPNNINHLREEIKKELFKKLNIILDVNMNMNTDEEYYMKFLKNRKFRNYIMNTSKFIIILGKYLQLSFCTICIALYYMNKYNQKILKRKKNTISYLIAGACIFLAWKLREDFELLKKSRKLYDIPKVIFKLLNYFYKKKKIKKKIHSIELDLITNYKINHTFYNTQIFNHKTFSSFMEHIKKENLCDISIKQEEQKKQQLNQASKNENTYIDTKKEHKNKKQSKCLHINNNVNNLQENKSIYNDLQELNNIIEEGYISDINNINHVSDCFSSYLSECNSSDVSEYDHMDIEQNETINKETDVKNENVKIKHEINGDLHEQNGDLDEQNGDLDEQNGDLDEQNGELHKKNGELHKKNGELHKKNGELHEQNGELREKNILTENIKKLKKLCKEHKKNIYVSSSKWVLNNSGQKLQLMQKIIIYYEGEILKSFNYHIKPKMLFFELLPSYINKFVYTMKGYIESDQVVYLEKLCFLTILDIYKTPLCLIFTPKEILITCILKAYISLKLLSNELHIRSLSFQDFEDKINSFIQSICCEDPINVYRIKTALRELRQLHF
ncbi:hypothetical protein PGSY75_0802400 [Plasmodium gaboni]|uniref:Uncharacterized protein n=1 Tax=Plasmodium gaboni TaxID=647221 RepID=A0A151LND5_9APIC|nr:hypothetical protein PGSY75_0802400 [Plasmodium gaboni]KYO00627.1 hypothetical protein PGSY75_0802400 [Plasmodium gaboni]